MGGMFGAIGALGALVQRGITGKGQEIQSALFENNVFLVGQHMLQYAITGKAAAPMPDRISAWAVYDVFTVKTVSRYSSPPSVMRSGRRFAMPWALPT